MLFAIALQVTPLFMEYRSLKFTAEAGALHCTRYFAPEAICSPVVGVSTAKELAAAKFAVIFLLLFMTTGAGFTVPLRSPLQPVKVYPAAGVAVSCTVVPSV